MAFQRTFEPQWYKQKKILKSNINKKHNKHKFQYFLKFSFFLLFLISKITKQKKTFVQKDEKLKN